MNKQVGGFTIVELLIVVVVIAILAAITIVSYNGITAQAKTSAGQSTSETVRTKASVWNAELGSYPDLAQLRTNSVNPPDMDTAGGAAGPAVAKLTDPTVAIGASMTEVRSENGRVVTYEPCWGGTSHTGARITYWSFSLTPAAAVTTTIGNCP